MKNLGPSASRAPQKVSIASTQGGSNYPIQGTLLCTHEAILGLVPNQRETCRYKPNEVASLFIYLYVCIYMLYLHVLAHMVPLTLIRKRFKHGWTVEILDCTETCSGLGWKAQCPRLNVAMKPEESVVRGGLQDFACYSAKHFP